MENIRLSTPGHISFYKLCNAYIQTQIINSFISSLAFFLAADGNGHSEYRDNREMYGLFGINGVISCKCLTFANERKDQQNGGYMENRHSKSNNAANSSDEIDKEKTAVALSYDPADAAPKVIASGKGYLAEKIIQKAIEADIPLHKDEKLAHSLSKLEIGEMIPPQLYDIVAEILVFVDKMDRIKEKVTMHEQ